MALAQLIFRVSGMTALCLAILVAPISSTERTLVLTAVSLGIGFAAVLPGYDRSAARIVGPAVLAVALLPSSGGWALLDLVALAVIGFASFNQAGMSRSVPALGLPIATVAFRTGETLSTGLLLAWLLAVIVTLILGNRAIPIDNGPMLGSPPTRGPVLGWRRAVQMVLAVAIVAPVAFALAGAVGRVVPQLLVPQPRTGAADGQGFVAHPGLTGGLDVGSPVELSDEVVLRVRSDRPHYWRGTTYERWDGRSWESEVEVASGNWSSAGVKLPELQDGPVRDGESTSLGLPEPEIVTQQFTTERTGLDVLLGAWRMDTLWTTNRRAGFGDDGSVLLDEPLLSGATWTVESSIVPATEDDLRRADPALLPRSAEVIQRYAHEDDITPEVAELAREITADASTTYDKVRAIEAWMDANIHYTREISSLAPGADAVHHLLFESRRGFCEQIGSSLVVMLRSLGIPTRLVVGYVPGEYDRATGEWLSRGSDAHAWAEVYFPGVGWQGFDPTAGVPLASDPGGDTEQQAVLAGRLLDVMGVASMIALLAAMGLWRLRHRGVAATSGLPKALVDLQRRFDACGSRLGLTWKSSTTLRRKADDLVGAGVGADVATATAGSLERIWYHDLDQCEALELDLESTVDLLDQLEHEVGALSRR